MRRSSAATLPTLLALVLAVLATAAPAGARPPRVERVWGRGGGSGPYTLEAFDHPAIGSGVFSVGYTGGVTAAGRDGVRWRWSDGTQVAEVAVGDLSGDGVPDVVVGSYFTTVSVLDGVTGDLLGAVEVEHSPEGLAIGEATGDGRPDLYVVTSAPSGGTNTLTLVDGTTLEPAWAIDLGYDQGLVMGADAADLDDDGLADVVFGTRSNGPKVHAHAADGTKLWEADLAGTVSRVAVADGGDTVFATQGASSLRALDGRTGSTRWTLPGSGSFSQLAAADLDGDGADDAVWSWYGATGKSPAFQVLGVDGTSGTPLWLVPTLSPPKDLVVGDLTGDGRPDVAASTQDINGNGGEQNFVWAIDGAAGRPLWVHPLVGERTTFMSDLALSDVAGDATPEVVVTTYFETLLGLDAADGEETWRAQIGSSVADALLTDLDGSGGLEAVDGSADFRVVARDAETGTVRWERDLGGQILDLADLPSGSGRDVLALSLLSLHRLRGTDGAVLWSLPLDGLGATMTVLEAGGARRVAVSTRLRRHDRGPGHNSVGGSLTLVDPADGRPVWTLRTPGTAWSLEVADLDGDGAAELVTGSPTAQWGVAVYDGAQLGTLPILAWQAATQGGVSALAVTAGSIVTVQASVRRVVALDPADGSIRWEAEPHAGGVSPIGFEDVTGDGNVDALVATDVFSEGIAAVDATGGDIVFDVPAGIRFVTAGRWTDVSGDGAPDLLFASSGGVFGEGGVFALDGATLDETEPDLLWSYESVNAFGLARVETAEELPAWLAWGVTTLPDALVLLQPFPEEPDEE